MTKTPTKTPVYEIQKWSLDDLFDSPESPKIESTFNELKEAVAAFEGHRSALRADISRRDFMGMIREIESMYRQTYSLYGFANLWFTEDTQNQRAQAFMARIQQFLAEMQNRTLFFSLWWKGLDEADAERLMSGSGDFLYWLQEMRNFKPHTLSEPEEKIINIKNLTGSTAMETLYDTITNRYTFKLKVNGEVQELNRDELTNYVYSPDASMRAQAYQSLFEVYERDAPVLGQMYQVLSRDWRNENIDLRRFKEPISVRNLYNDIPDDVVETLLAVCKRNAPLFHRFFRLKARWLGLDKLRRYDVYAPVSASDKTYEYNQAVDMVLQAFGQFDPLLAAHARTLFEKEHVDSEIRKGKMGGAFCLSLDPKMVPWVLLNYKGVARDVAVLAHELGHAIHTLMASEHSILTFHSSLPLAETASTFGEMLLLDHLLAHEEDEDVRRDLLFRQMDDAYATIIRQAFFAMFERQAHQMVIEGASVDQLAESYFQILQDQFGDSLELNEEFRWEWVAIPHIYSTPFYVYAYAFGQLLVFSLYKQYKAEGEAFKPRLMRILAAGGSAAPIDILSEAGIDVHSAEFWQGGFDVIEENLRALEAMQQ